MTDEALQSAFNKLVERIIEDKFKQPTIPEKLRVQDYAQEIDRIVRIIKLNY